MTPDIHIIGGGLAGSTLAWACLDRGATVRLTDRADPASASRVAAGLITPLTGHRLAKSWRFDDFYPAAIRLYADVELLAGIRVFDANTTVRIVHTEGEASDIARRADTLAGHLRPTDPTLNADTFATPFGSYELFPSGRLDVPAFLAAVRRRLGHGFALATYRTPPDHHRHTTGTPPVALWTVICQGYPADLSVPGLTFRATKGEVLELDLPNVTETRTINRHGTWLTPCGGGRFLAGSTYDHDDLTTTPTAAGREQILARVQSFLRVPVPVVGHRAGVRPIVRASRPVLGTHPTMPGVAYFNGLGSKGALTAPYFAGQLADHLLFGRSLDKEVDLAYFDPSPGR